MEDIKIIGGDLAYEKIQVLPSVYDRIEAIFYHCRFIENYCSLRDFIKAKWHFRSVLAEFKSVAPPKFDILKSDLRRLHKDKIWEKSNFKQNIEKSVLIQILSKVRNLTTHTDRIEGDVRKFIFTYLDW